MEERIEWHNKNISNFVAKWKSYVAPPAAQAGPARAARSGLDNKLPE